MLIWGNIISILCLRNIFIYDKMLLSQEFSDLITVTAIIVTKSSTFWMIGCVKFTSDLLYNTYFITDIILKLNGLKTKAFRGVAGTVPKVCVQLILRGLFTFFF